MKFPEQEQADVSTQRGPKSLENMLDDLKLYWLEKITYTRVLAEPEFNAATLPPVIVPLLRAQQVLNTEGEKKSVYLSANADGESRLFTSGRTYRNANSAASQLRAPERSPNTAQLFPPLNPWSMT